MRTYFILHGTGGHQFENWFPWLWSKLESRGEKCFVPQFPAGEGQNYKQWKTILKGYYDAGLIDENTVFIGHSLGCVFATRFVVEMRIDVAGIVAVSGFNGNGNVPEINALNESFLTTNRKLAKVSKFVKFFHCIYSDNDPYLPIELLEDFAKTVGAKVHQIEGAGHLNSSAGYNEFPFLLELLDKIDTIV